MIREPLRSMISGDAVQAYEESLDLAERQLDAPRPFRQGWIARTPSAPGDARVWYDG